MPRHVPARELLDLKSVLALDVGKRMDAVPGFRTSATFFTFLRSNLVLPPSSSTFNSTNSTPLISASSSQTLPPLQFNPSLLSTMSDITSTPSAVATTDSSPTNPLDGVPPLVTKTLTDQDDKIDALQVIADTIAQQRQYASRAVIFHPLTIAAYILLLALLSQFIYKSSADIGKLLTTSAGVTMACLVGVRGMTSGYLSTAEAYNWESVKNEEGEEDIILGSRYGPDLIGALVLRLERSAPSSPQKKGKKAAAKQGGNGVIRAWSVKNRYRGKGVGTELLEEAIKITREKLGRDAGVGFAAEHANAKAVLPGIFNGAFRRREVKAGRRLEMVLEEIDGGGRKKR